VRAGRSSDAKPGATLDNYERMAIERALIETDGDIDEAAKTLGVGKSTLYRKMKIHGLKVPKKHRK
jgi:transcriptional regulator of acetoin/glycerol metabolism